MTVFSTETTGAIRRRLVDPPVNTGMVPPHPLDVVKPPEEESDGSRPTASSSNDPTIPVPMTTPHSFAPSAAGPADNADIDYDTPQPGSQETIQLLFMIR